MMKLMSVAVAMVLGATLSAGAAGADPKANSNPSPVEKAADTKAAAPSDQQRYCVEDTLTGSRITHRECKTRAEWMKEGFDPLNP